MCMDMYFEFNSLSEAFCGLAKKLIDNGVWARRGKNAAGNMCLEFPGAVLIKIKNPTNRYCFVPERKWNKTLGWVESLWIASGSNDLAMPARYVKNLYSFSDDGRYMRAGYGPRIRRFGDNFNRYELADGKRMYRQYGNSHSGVGIDQLKFVIEKFKEDLGTREAVITIHDAMSDDFDMGAGGGALLVTKDTPCTRSIHFMVVDGKMNCYVDMRSNDLLWGFSAVNVFNFTLMQEYVAMMVGVPVGEYYHKVDNLHIYESSLPTVKAVAEHYNGFWQGEDSALPEWHYEHGFTTLQEFDAWVERLASYEANLRGDVNLPDLPYTDSEALERLKDFDAEPLFADWARIFYRKWIKKPVNFVNPYLNILF